MERRWRKDPKQRGDGDGTKNKEEMGKEPKQRREASG